MEKTVEKSQEQADIINAIALPILMLDVEYCREAASDMCNQAIRQESMMVINPGYPQLKNDILRKQGEALRLLCDYVSTLKEVEKIKAKLADQQASENKMRDEIGRMFL